MQGSEAAFASKSQFKPEGVTLAHPLCHGCDFHFGKVGAHGQWARIRITYTNPDKTLRFAALHVNDQPATRIAFPPTGTSPATVIVQALFDRKGATNVLDFSQEHDVMPTIASIDVQ